MSSASCASATVLGQEMSSRPSRSDITQPLSRLVWKVPSLSLRALKAGLVSRRSLRRPPLAIAISTRHRGLDGGDIPAGFRGGDDLGFARRQPLERRLHGVDLVDRDDDRAMAVGMHQIAALNRYAVDVHIDPVVADMNIGMRRHDRAGK